MSSDSKDSRFWSSMMTSAMGRFLTAQMIRRGFEVSNASERRRSPPRAPGFRPRRWFCSISPAPARAPWTSGTHQANQARSVGHHAFVAPAIPK